MSQCSAEATTRQSGETKQVHIFYFTVSLVRRCFTNPLDNTVEKQRGKQYQHVSACLLLDSGEPLKSFYTEWRLLFFCRITCTGTAFRGVFLCSQHKQNNYNPCNNSSTAHMDMSEWLAKCKLILQDINWIIV